MRALAVVIAATCLVLLGVSASGTDFTAVLAGSGLVVAVLGLFGLIPALHQDDVSIHFD